MALTNLEGLVCDPVAGLVEIPCVKRNVIGAMNAVSAADMALAGVVGHIPADEVIDAMAEVGNAMSKDLRETGIGGLAGTPTGCKIAEIVTMSADTEEKDSHLQAVLHNFCCKAIRICAVLPFTFFRFELY